MKLKNYLNESCVLFDRRSTQEDREKYLDKLKGFSCYHDEPVAQKFYEDEYECVLDARKSGIVKCVIVDPSGEEVEYDTVDSENALKHFIEKADRLHK